MIARLTVLTDQDWPVVVESILD